MTPLHEAVLAALADGGAVFFRMLHERVSAELASAAGTAKAPSDADVAAAVWDLVWAGRLTNDTLGPLRTVLGGGQPRRAASPGASGPAPSRGRGLRSGSRRPSYGRPVMPSRTGPPNVSGRWSLLPDASTDATVRAHALAQSLLDRYGILTKGAVAAERVPGGFAAVYSVLRAMEEAGRARRGYFVAGLGAAQFAIPGAVDRMRALAQPPSGTDEALTSITHGRPAPYGGAGHGGGAAGGAVYGGAGHGSAGHGGAATAGRVMGDGASGGDGAPSEIWEYERDGAGDTGGGNEDGGADAGRGADEACGTGAGGTGALGTGPGGTGAFGNGPGGNGAFGTGAGGGNGAGVTGRDGAGRRTQVIVLAAADPANVYGASLPWPARPDETPGGHRPGRKAGALVVLADGELVLYVERGGRSFLSWTDDPDQLGPAVTALAAAVRAGALGRAHRGAGRRRRGLRLAAGQGAGGGRFPADSQGPAPARLGRLRDTP